MRIATTAAFLRRQLGRLSHNAYFLVGLLIALQSLSQFLFKVGANQTRATSIWATVFHPIVLLGILGFILTFPVMVNLHKLWPLKKMPIINLSLVCSILLAVIFLAETMTPFRAIGIALILTGSLLLGGSE